MTLYLIWIHLLLKIGIVRKESSATTKTEDLRYYTYQRVKTDSLPLNNRKYFG